MSGSYFTFNFNEVLNFILSEIVSFHLHILYLTVLKMTTRFMWVLILL